MSAAPPVAGGRTPASTNVSSAGPQRVKASWKRLPLPYWSQFMYADTRGPSCGGLPMASDASSDRSAVPINRRTSDATANACARAAARSSTAGSSVGSEIPKRPFATSAAGSCVGLCRGDSLRREAISKKGQRGQQRRGYGRIDDGRRQSRDVPRELVRTAGSQG